MNEMRMPQAYTHNIYWLPFRIHRSALSLFVFIIAQLIRWLKCIAAISFSWNEKCDTKSDFRLDFQFKKQFRKLSFIEKSIRNVHCTLCNLPLSLFVFIGGPSNLQRSIEISAQLTLLLSNAAPNKREQRGTRPKINLKCFWKLIICIEKWNHLAGSPHHN